ncbi:hypothetical protein [uncultured Marivirga sp.]|uniref:hypothetical protein n=1 Tax=uncultured Marivirga sp. TaxID=1123707 RepID=UPI0030EC0E7B
MLILFLAVLFFRLPYIIGSEPLVYEVDWLLVGEVLNSGKVLYKDLISPISPLSAWTYMVVDFVFGKSILVLHILSVLLVTYQFSLFNNIMLRNKAYNENSYIPALIYALILFTFYDFFTLSPALISLTFILLVLDNIYLRIENKLQDATILKTGIFMGLAVLFYLPSIFFLLATILSFALLTSLVLRRYLLFLYGFTFPIALVLIYFYWQDGLEALISQWIEFNLFNSVQPVIDLRSILLIVIIPTLVFLVALYKTFSAKRFTNYQVRVQQVMFIMFLAAFGSWWISEKQAPYELLAFVPSVAFFIIHLIFQFRNKMRAELFTLIFSIALIALNYTMFYQYSALHFLGDFNALKSSKSIHHELVKDKSVMILGGSTDIYKSVNRIATDYYDPTLSEIILMEMSEKEQSMALYKDIQKNQPEIILDFTGIFNHHYDKLVFKNMKYKQLSKESYVRN